MLEFVKICNMTLHSDCKYNKIIIFCATMRCYFHYSVMIDKNLT